VEDLAMVVEDEAVVEAVEVDGQGQQARRRPSARTAARPVEAGPVAGGGLRPTSSRLVV